MVRELRTADPLVDLRALRDRAAVGSLLTNLAVGAALMAALVDIPVFARATVDPDSQVAAALVLARLLVAVPVGAVLGGLLVGRAGYRAVAERRHAADRRDVRAHGRLVSDRAQRQPRRHRLAARQ